MSTFTPSACYDLATHNIVFTKQGVDVVYIPTNQKVDGATFAAGFDIKVENGSFCFGTITFTTSFEVKVSLKKRSGGFEFEYLHGVAKVFGSDELDIPQVTKHVYRIDQCPIRLHGDAQTVRVTCPCTTGGTPCTNSCYSTLP